MTEDNMVGCHHQLNGYESEQALMVKDRESWYASVHGITTEEQQQPCWGEKWRRGSKTLQDPLKVHSSLLAWQSHPCVC